MSDETPPERTVYVERAKNSMATAALVLGIIGVVSGLIPILFFIAFACGILGIVLGAIARRRAKTDKRIGGKTMATWGLSLGVVAVVLGIVGVVIVDDAVTDLDRELQELIDDTQE